MSSTALACFADFVLHYQAELRWILASPFLYCFNALTFNVRIVVDMWICLLRPRWLTLDKTNRQHRKVSPNFTCYEVDAIRKVDEIQDKSPRGSSSQRLEELTEWVAQPQRVNDPTSRAIYIVSRSVKNTADRPSHIVIASLHPTDQLRCLHSPVSANQTSIWD